MKRISCLLFFLCFVSSCFFSCKKETSEKFQKIETLKITFEDGTFFTGNRLPDSEKKGNYFSKISHEIPYGGGLYYKIPDSLLNKDIKVIINSKLRTNESFTYGHLFAVTLNSTDQQLFWSQIDLDPHISQKNKWIEMKDSTLIPSSKNNKMGAEIRVFGFNASKKSYMEYDHLEVTFLSSINN